MSARPISSATVSFGLVSVPVKLYSTADNSQKVTFNWINPKTGSRVRQRYWDASEERLVELFAAEIAPLASIVLVGEGLPGAGLALPEGTVKSRMHVAVRRLRDRLAAVAPRGR